MSIRKTYSGKLKGNVAVEAVKEANTVAELASQYKVHPTQITAWKRHLPAHVEELFVEKRRKARAGAGAGAGAGGVGRGVIQADRPIKGGVRLDEKKAGLLGS